MPERAELVHEFVRNFSGIRTHGCAKTSVYLEHCEFVEIVRTRGFGEFGIGYNLVFGRGPDALPVAEEIIKR